MALKHRAEAALAADGVQRTWLGYDVLVQLKRDDLLVEELCAGGAPRLALGSKHIPVEEMHDAGR